MWWQILWTQRKRKVSLPRERRRSGNRRTSQKLKSVISFDPIKKITLVDMEDCDFTKKNASRPKQPRDQKLKLKNTTVDEHLRKAEFKSWKVWYTLKFWCINFRLIWTYRTRCFSTKTIEWRRFPRKKLVWYTLHYLNFSSLYSQTTKTLDPRDPRKQVVDALHFGFPGSTLLFGRKQHTLVVRHADGHWEELRILHFLNCLQWVLRRSFIVQREKNCQRRKNRTKTKQIFGFLRNWNLTG